MGVKFKTNGANPVYGFGKGHHNNHKRRKMSPHQHHTVEFIGGQRFLQRLSALAWNRRKSLQNTNHRSQSIPFSIL